MEAFWYPIQVNQPSNQLHLTDSDRIETMTVCSTAVLQRRSIAKLEREEKKGQYLAGLKPTTSMS